MQKKSSVHRLAVLTGLILIMAIPVSGFCKPAGKLIIFHAGSLTIPFQKMEKAFEKNIRRWIFCGRQEAVQKWQE